MHVVLPRAWRNMVERKPSTADNHPLTFTSPYVCPFRVSLICVCKSHKGQRKPLSATTVTRKLDVTSVTLKCICHSSLAPTVPQVRLLPLTSTSPRKLNDRSVSSKKSGAQSRARINGTQLNFVLENISNKTLHVLASSVQKKSSRPSVSSPTSSSSVCRFLKNSPCHSSNVIRPTRSSVKSPRTRKRPVSSDRLCHVQASTLQQLGQPLRGVVAPHAAGGVGGRQIFRGGGTSEHRSQGRSASRTPPNRDGPLCLPPSEDVNSNAFLRPLIKFLHH